MSARRWPLILLALAGAYVVKRWYSHATAESLGWMMAPTAWVVGRLYQAPFCFVSGYGYYSVGLRFGIVPACAGINFLVIAAGAFTCGILPQVQGLSQRLRWLFGAGVALYAVTLLANTTRIVIAVWLQLHPLDLDHAQLHRIEGSLVYLTFLFGFYALAQSRVPRVPGQPRCGTARGEARCAPSLRASTRRSGPADRRLAADRRIERSAIDLSLRQSLSDRQSRVALDRWCGVNRGKVKNRAA